jgi:hypothetical protein
MTHPLILLLRYALQAALVVYCVVHLIWSLAHAEPRPWPGAWLPTASLPEMEARWANMERILATPDGQLTAEELRFKRNWLRK